MKRIFSVVILLIVIFLVFRAWFLPGIIANGDLDFFYSAMFSVYPLHFYAWSWKLGNGMGAPAAPFGWFYYDFAVPLFLGRLFRISWPILERLTILLPYLLVCIGSSLYVYKKLFPKNPFYLLSSAIFLFNTYALMLVGGGQIIGIGLAYAFSPFVLWQFINTIDFYFSNHLRSIRKLVILKKTTVTGLVFALELFFDLRFAYILIAAAGIYFLLQIWHTFSKKSILEKLYSSVFIFFLPTALAAILHAFWILPIFFSHQSPAAALSPAYTTQSAVQYLSFAKLEDSIALLHPNWPENIFGKTYFMRPEFLLLPLLAFCSLLFIKVKHNTQEVLQMQHQKPNKSSREQSTIQRKTVVYFSLLGLLGIFLAKGTNDPLGGIFLWLFAHVPGFIVFRDPTKFYLLIAISYSILIPYSVSRIYQFLKEKKLWTKLPLPFLTQSKKILIRGENLFLLAVFIYFLILIRPAIDGKLTGTFVSHTVPPEYTALAQFLLHQKSFSRTFWMPMTQRFGFYDSAHPAISASELWNTSDPQTLLKKFNTPQTEKRLHDSDVQYVIVPYDSENEIYLKNREEDPLLYKNYVNSLKNISWLHQLTGFGRITVFALSRPKNLFWVSSTDVSVSTTVINPTQYQISLQNVQDGDKLIFSENFDPHWQLVINNLTIHPQRYDQYLTSFTIPFTGTTTGVVSFSLQDYVDTGSFIAVITIISFIGAYFLQIYNP